MSASHRRCLNEGERTISGWLSNYRVVFIPDCLSSDSTLAQANGALSTARKQRVTRERKTLPWTSYGRRAQFVRAAKRAGQRRDLKAARSSDENSSGSSQAAKWPPLSASLK
jgi:hypothetical protein